MLIMLDIIEESMYKSAMEKGKDKKKDVRKSNSHIHNKPHVLIAVSKHPALSFGSDEETE
jgi:hypothetical protein